jgi:type IV secretion system protein VirD4
VIPSPTPEAFAIAVVLIAALWIAPTPSARRGKGAARFAARADLRGLIVRRPIPGRITLGRRGRRLLAIEYRHSLLVIGPPQTGKTAGLAIPAILEWPGPVLVTSSKSDILEITQAGRRARGEVMVYDPISDPERSVGWTPLAGAGDWTGALVAARAMMAAIPGGDARAHDFWYAAAEAALAPMLRAAAETGDMSRLVSWLDTGEDADAEIARVLQDLHEPLAYSAWRAVTTLDPRTRSGVIATARTVLAGWWDPKLLASARPELTPARLLEGANSLFLVAPTHEQERLRNVYCAIVSEMTRAVYSRRTRTGTPLDPPLLVVLDEAAHIAPVRELGALAATGPEPGIQLVTIFHDHAQIRAIYGTNAATVIANHRARLFLPGIGDPETLEQISRSLGTTQRTRTSQTRGRLGHSTTATPAPEPLISAHQLRELANGTGLVVYGSRPPMRVSLRFWFSDGRLRRMAVGQGPPRRSAGSARRVRTVTHDDG